MKRPNYNDKLVIPAIAFGVFVIRVLPLALRDGSSWALDPNSDSIAYIALATGIRHGCGLGYEMVGGCVADTGRTPGYPWFLSIVPSLRAAIAIQAALSAVVVLMIGRFVERIWGLRAAVASMVFCALDVVWIVNSNEIMSDTIFTVLAGSAVVLGLYSLEDGLSFRRAIALALGASVAAAMALLTRPSGIVLLLIPAPAMLLAGHLSRSRKALLAGCLVAIPIAVFLGWSLRNERLTGVFTISRLGRERFYFDDGAGTLAFANSISMAEAARLLPVVPDSGKSKAALKIILAHPVAFVEATLWSGVYLAVIPERGPLAQLLDLHQDFPIREPAILRVREAFKKVTTDPARALEPIFVQEFYSSWILVGLTIFQMIWVALMWVGVCFAVFKRSSGYRFVCTMTLMTIALGFMVIAADPMTVPRYRLPAIPMLAIVAGVGWFAPKPNATRNAN